MDGVASIPGRADPFGELFGDYDTADEILIKESRYSYRIQNDHFPKDLSEKWFIL